MFNVGFERRDQASRNARLLCLDAAAFRPAGTRMLVAVPLHAESVGSAQVFAFGRLLVNVTLEQFFKTVPGVSNLSKMR